MTEIGQRLAFAGESPDQTRGGRPSASRERERRRDRFRHDPVLRRLESGRPAVAREGQSGALILMRDDEKPG